MHKDELPELRKLTTAMKNM